MSTATLDHRDKVSRNALGIGIAVGVYAVSFGVLSVTAGLSPAQTCVMSMLTFTGASQFAYIGVLAGGGGALAALGPAVLLASRNAAYGLSLTPILPKRLRDRMIAAQFVIDETTAMARSQEKPDDSLRAFKLTAASVWIFWNIGTLIGAVVGSGIGNPQTYGLDAMFPAAFLALMGPQLRRPGAPVAAITGALLAVILVPLTPVGVPVIAALVGLVPGILAANGRRR